MAFMRAGLLVLCLLLFFLGVLSMSLVCRPGSRKARALDGALCRIVLRLLRVRVTVAGRPSPMEANRLVVANHVSWLDTLVMGSVEPVCFLAKREVGSWPVVSTFARFQGTVFVDRRRRRLLPQVNRAIAERLRAGRTMVLFPEGTTYEGSRRGRFFTSHLAGLRDWLPLQPTLQFCAVQPAALVYDDPVAAWVGEATLLPHVWSILNHPGVACTLVYGAPRCVERGFDRKQLAADLAADVEHLVKAVSF